ncbi:MAG TPA: hypothetical protein VG015_02535 [Candidatus Dormibacteraeota bacterium]|jgi:hypothetical protein|nr:hypothetical protein [Candidatus Dormibacteraeota bacterium]
MFNVLVHAGSGRHTFAAGWAGEGWPADVERLALLAPGIEVVVAKDLSMGAREWLDSHQIGWVDETGRANLKLPSGLVVVTTPGPAGTAGRIVRQPSSGSTDPKADVRWTPGVLAIAEAALSGTRPTVEAMQQATGLSRGGTANSLARLESLGLLSRPATRRGAKSARWLSDPSALLDAYAAAAPVLRDSRPVVLVHRLWDDPMATLASEIAPALNAAGVCWAATGAAASSLLAPYLTAVTVLDLYVDGVLFADRVRLADLLGGRLVERGHRIQVRELPAVTSAMGPIINGIRVAAPARVYADLIADGGRAAEAAHHLRETIGVGNP